MVSAIEPVDDPLDMQGVAEHLGVNYATVRLWNANRIRKVRQSNKVRQTTTTISLPYPNGWWGNGTKPWWRTSTIDEWNANVRTTS